MLAMNGETTALAAQDERVAGISFTGSDRVGWGLEAANPKKR